MQNALGDYGPEKKMGEKPPLSKIVRRWGKGGESIFIRVASPLEERDGQVGRAQGLSGDESVISHAEVPKTIYLNCCE